MTVREVVLQRDIRAPFDLSPASLLNRYYLRRFLSTLALVVMDVLAIVVGAWLAVELIRIFVTPDFGYPSPVGLGAVSVVAILFFLLNGLYERRFRRHSLRRILRATGMTIAVIFFAALVMGLALYHVSAVLTIAFAVVLALALRAAYDWTVNRLYPGGHLKPVLLVGRPQSCEVATSLMAGQPAFRDCHIVGAVCDGAVSGDMPAEQVLSIRGSLDHLDTVIARSKPAELVVCDLDLARDRMPTIVDTCRRHHVVLKLAAVDIDFSPEPITLIANPGTPIFVFKPPELAYRHFFAKRLVDLAAAALLSVLLAPLMLTIALAIKLTSPGPVFFVDERVGLGQRSFRCYKFRTMYRDAAQRQGELEALNEAGGAIFKIRNDPRVTRVGRFLRRTSLDELPQVFNVLKGDMSLVGPRPLPLRDYSLLDDVHKQRHVVLPGITGLWQVSGRSELSFDDMIALDFRYIEKWSILTDASILAKTVGAVCGFKGAY